VSARIRLGDHTATCTDYHWHSDHQPTADMLNAHLHPHGPSGADPNADGTMARRMAERYGGTVEHVDDVPFDPNVVY
jgi:acetyl-CoA acetyltransferase